METDHTARLANARPDVGVAEAQRLLALAWRLTPSDVAALPGDRDRNFRVATETGRGYVLKVSHVDADAAHLAVQHEAMRRAARAGLPVPRPVETDDGRETVPVADARGRVHLARMVTYLDGTPLALARPVTPALRRALGRLLGTLAEAWEGWRPEGATFDTPWDPARAAEVIRACAPALPAPRRRLVLAAAEAFERDVALALPTLPHAVIHGDANDHNVLVGPPRFDGRDLTGLIDFGDLLWSMRAAEPAIAGAYAMLDRDDPVGACADVVAGFDAVCPLDDAELAAVYPLARARLAVSVCVSALRKEDEPDDPYLTVSEAPAWRTLERLADVAPSLAHYRLRAACGREPVPQAPALRAWLAAHRDDLAPVLDPDPRTANPIVFDFSVGSDAWDAEVFEAPGLAEAAIEQRMLHAGAAVGVGRWDEPRVVYASDQFAIAGGERRTIHMGMDLFAPAGTPVRAPLDGVVHSVADNALPLDYGPTLILRHEPPGAPAFYTLYGHLGRDVLGLLAEGDRVERGQRIGCLGARDENGGWVAHLHFQVMLDVLGRTGDFPGVAPASQRDVWRSLCPDPNRIVGVPQEAYPEREPTAVTLLERRARHLSPSLSLSYEAPLHIVRGRGAFLYDARAHAFLDGVNNVAHVGHGHPRVVQALARQAAVLNTNTRYLHPHVVRYAERLAAYLPGELSVCFFVNSGSEANDLALRLARAHTGRQDVVVLEGAYHGHLSTLIDVSPYKHDGPGGAGAPPTTHVVPLPDPYRGRHRGEDAGAGYAGEVRRVLERLAARGRAPAAFIAEAMPGCGGQIVPPAGFLRDAFAQARAAGAVCIADEVQTGFGRVGSPFWAFEAQDAVPDIVTLGKPMGNGHPIGGVVTTPAIAASFANGMEYFNTYGGNPVSCAAGLAVLDVLEDEGLPARAASVGQLLLDGLAALASRHPVVGDVRGRGLFLGVEFVRDAERTPAPEVARYVVERMRERGILLSTDGPAHNVVKIKPPMVFERGHAERLLETLDDVLAHDGVRAAFG